jgi:hypothetical protein
MANSTIEDLVLFMYNESNASHRAAVELELQQSWALKEKYSVLKESARRINNMPLQSPRRQTINAIMQYAMQTAKITS